MELSSWFNGWGAIAKVLGVGWFAACALGCGDVGYGDDEYEGEEEEIGSLEQALNGIGHTILSTTVTKTWTVGSTANNTACFLTGVSGRLAMMVSSRHGARIFQSGSDWKMTIRTSNGAKIAAGVACVTPASGLTSEVTWSSTQSAKTVASVTNNRRCFLTRVEASVGGQLGSAFEVFGDNVRVAPSGGNWVLDGSADRGRIDAAARCFDVTWDTGSWQWIAPNNGFASHDLANAAPGVGVCMLTGIGGGFLSTNDTADGVQIKYVNPTKWVMEVKNAKTGWANCSE